MRKTVLIVGGGCIGGCAAKLLIRKGYEVFVASTEASGIDGATDMPLDVRDKAAVRNVINDVGKRGLCALVYTAGVSMAAPFEYTEERDCRRVFDVNYFGFVCAAQAAIKHMKACGGKIIAVSSMGGTFPLIYDPFYSASKAALDITVKEMNSELRKFGITVTSVLPGGTATPFSFDRHVYGKERAGEYNGEMRLSANSLILKEQNGDTPELVAKRIARIIDCDRPPITVATGIRNKALRVMNRLLPERLILYINERMQIKNGG